MLPGANSPGWRQSSAWAPLLKRNKIWPLKWLPVFVHLTSVWGYQDVALDLQKNDIRAIARGARKEALMNYPAPRHMSLSECEGLLHGLLAA